MASDDGVTESAVGSDRVVSSMSASSAQACALEIRRPHGRLPLQHGAEPDVRVWQPARVVADLTPSLRSSLAGARVASELRDPKPRRCTRMRIIAGDLKGRRLEAPDWDGLRPTSDKLRETLFNVLGAADRGARVLDGYAGTGAVGHRGAEPRRGARDVRRARSRARSRSSSANLERCGVTDRYAIIRARFAGAARRAGRRAVRHHFSRSAVRRGRPGGGARRRRRRSSAPDALLVIEHAQARRRRRRTRTRIVESALRSLSGDSALTLSIAADSGERRAGYGHEARKTSDETMPERDRRDLSRARSIR